MADIVDVKVINATKRKYSVRLINVYVDTGETAGIKVDISALTGLTRGEVLYTVIEEMQWNVQGYSSVRLHWDHNTDDEISVLSGAGAVSYRDIGGLVDPRSTGGTGDILVTTAGTTAGSSYDITLVIRLKDA